MRREYAPLSLPEYIYVVTRERVCAGRGPLKLRPIEYVYHHSEGYPICIKAAPARSSTEPRLIPLDICHASAQDASIAVQEIAEKEAQTMLAKLNRQKKQLQKARNAARSFLE